jgi:hypothetical protein
VTCIQRKRASLFPLSLWGEGTGAPAQVAQGKCRAGPELDWRNTGARRGRPSGETMLASSAIDRLQRIVERERASGAADGLWFSDVVERFVGGEPFEQALGLDPNWRARARYAERDRLVCEVAAQLAPGVKPWARARRFSLVLARYRACAWSRDRLAATCPRSGVEAELWHILKLADTALSPRHVLRILNR